MSTNIKVSGKVYNGVQNIVAKTDENTQVNFLLQSVEPSKTYFNYVTFIDYDGTVVASYTKAEFLALTTLPANPTHSQLIAEGWNWTLADAKAYVTTCGELVIGQLYHTASGKTEYDVKVNEATGMSVYIGHSDIEKDWGDGTVNTNTSHVYTEAGNYTIKFSGTALMSMSTSRHLCAVRIANGVTNIGDNYFYACYSLKYVTIPLSVTIIGNYTFNYCYSLQSVALPLGVTSIGNSTFYACCSLQSIAMPSSVTSIGNSAFNNCYTLQSITIPSSITTIDKNAIANCYCLQSITIPSNIVTIGDNVFYNCASLTIIIVLATTPPTLGNSVFGNMVTKIYIPNGTLTAYQTATNWSAYSSLFVELPA